MRGSGPFHSVIWRAPLLRAVLPFIAGLLAGRTDVLPLVVAWSAVMSTATFWWWAAHRPMAFGQRWWRGAAIVPALFALGLLWQRLHTADAHEEDVSRWSGSAEGWRAEVLEVASSNTRTVRLWVRAEAALGEGRAHAASGKLLLTLLHDSAAVLPSIGDRVLVAAAAGPIARVPDPGGFDVAAWARSNDVAFGCFAPEGHWRIVRRAAGWSAWFEGARRQVTDWLVRSGLPDRERALAKAVLLGVRDELNEDQKASFARSGTMHVLAVSGSHVGIVYAAFLWGLAFLGRKRPARMARGLLVLLALWAYAGLTGFTPSVLRATVTFSVFTIAEMAQRRTEPLNSLAASAFVLLWWDPAMLLQLGFQLSFLAVLGIALFYRPIVQAWTPPNAVASFFWSLFAVSVAAQAFTTPLSLLVFQAFPTWFLPANMVIVGLVSLGVYGGTLVVLCHGVPVLGPALAYGFELLLRLLGGASTFFAEAPGAYPAVRIDGWQCLGLYVLVLLVAAWLFQRWRWARMGTVLLVAMLLVSWAVSARARNGQRRFTVYDDRRALCFAVVEGRAMTVFSEHADERVRRRAERHGRSLGIERLAFVDSLPAVVSAPGPFRILVGASAVGRTAADVPCLLIARPGGPPAGPVEAEAVVIGPGLRGKERERWAAWARERRIPVHDVRERGAYVRSDDRGGHQVAAAGR